MATPLNDIISEISRAQHTSVEVKSQLHLGYSNNVYELLTDNNERWCLRIPVDTGAGCIAVRGTNILKDVKEKRPTLRAPTVVHSSEQYTILEFLPGYPLGSWNTSVLAKARRQMLLDDLASFLFSLWGAELYTPKQAGRRTRYTEWLRDEVDRGLRRTLQGTSRWGDPIHYLQRRTMIDDLVPSPDDGLIAVRHGDLNAWNVIITDSGLSGIVDWDTSQIVPAASAIQHPLFIADVPGWRNDGVPHGMTFEEDRAYLEHAIRKLEGGSAPGAIATLLETSRERQFFELSLHNSRINDEYVERRLRGRIRKDAALEQLEDFLSTHEPMRNLPNVLDVRAQLKENHGDS